MGASGFSLNEEKIIHYKAKAIILCFGSGGFKPNGFPMCDFTHDGSIMAYNRGAKITGKEWSDGHPGSAENSRTAYENWQAWINLWQGENGEMQFEKQGFSHWPAFS